MAPKRTRLAVAAAEAAAAVVEMEGQRQSDTLATAAQQQVTRLLNRAAKRQARATGVQPPVLPPQVGPMPALVPGLPGARPLPRIGACGAAAVACQDDSKDKAEPEQADAPSPAGGAAPRQRQQAQQVQKADNEEWEDAWEGSAPDEEWEEVPAGTPSAPCTTEDGEQETPTEGLTIVLNRDGSEAAEGSQRGGASGSSARRRGVTKADRERAQLVHRSHLLCLLARAQALDAAASDPLLQAQLLSLVPQGPAAKLHEGTASGSTAAGVGAGGCSLAGLHQQVQWFKSAFKLLPPAVSSGSSRGVEDPVLAALLAPSGPQAWLQRLGEALEQRAGTAEQLVALFAALLRGQGAMVRTVRVLEPSPLRPTEAAKAKQAALEAFVRRFGPGAARYCPPAVAAMAPSAPSSKGLGLSDGPQPLLAAAHRAAAAAASLLSGEEGRKVDQLLLAAARRHGLPDASAFWLVGPRAAGGLPEDEPSAGFDNVIFRDPQKSHQQWKQLKAAREGGGAGALPPGPASGRGGRAGRGGRGGRGRGKQQAASPQSAEASAAVAASAAADAEAGTAAAKKSNRGRKRQQAEAPSSLVGTAEEEHSRRQDVQQDGQQQGQQQQQQQQQKGSQRKRKGDLDEERALQAAMHASLAHANGTAASGPPSGAGGSERRGPARGAGTPKGEAAAAAAAAAGSRPGSATMNKQSPDAGLLWVEVYCRSEEGWDGNGLAGRWVPADPLTGFVDRPRDVEANLPKERQPVAYAVALAGSGAKDVTSRYTASWVAAEKLREGDWWEATLRPLRERERAATLAAAGAATEGGSSPPAQTGMRAAVVQARRQKLAAAAEKQAAALLVDQEDAELAERAQLERSALPTTLDGFRRHEKYVLERHIPRHQAIPPTVKKVGDHRGEPYWRRSDLVPIHTAEQWRREGREVLPQELACPVRWLKKRANPAANRGGGVSWVPTAGSAASAAAAAFSIDELEAEEEEGDEEQGGDGSKPNPKTHSAFYGPWQTRPWKPPAAANGRIPVNARGNVEVPPFVKQLPEGVVHLPHPYIKTTCKKLGVEWADALVGFERRKGMNFPSIQGVVVLAEDAEAVMEAYTAWQREKEERERRKRDEDAEEAWRALLRATLAKVQVEKLYGSGAQQAGAGAMADAAAALQQQEAAPVKKRGSRKGGTGGAAKKGGATDAGRSGSGNAGEANVVGVADSDSDGPGAAAARQQQEQQQQQLSAAAHLADVDTEEI